MPSYDPNASRPRVVDSDEPAPIDSLIDAPPAPVAPEPVAPAPVAPEPVTDEPVADDSSRAKQVLVVAVAAATALSLMMAWRRRH